jgi:glycosyltransferase involved in cell wall biosynthesis
MNYKVSIIIPIFNVEKYIIRCLDSVVKQTITESVECILVDDCGSDNSMLYVDTFLSNTNSKIPFSIIHHPTNLGLSEARNTGIRSAKGEYLFFLDSDDKIATDCIEQLLLVEKTHVGIDLIQGLYVWTTRPFIEKLNYTENREIIKRMLLDYDIIPVNAQNKLVRRDLIVEHGLYFMKGIIHEDNQWNYHLAKHVKSFMICSHNIYYYYNNPGSICNSINIEKEKYSHEAIIKDYCDNIDNICIWGQKRSIALLYSSIIKMNYYHNQDSLKEIKNKVRSVHGIIEWVLLKLWLSIPESQRKLKIHFFSLLVLSYKLLNK